MRWGLVLSLLGAVILPGCASPCRACRPTGPCGAGSQAGGAAAPDPWLAQARRHGRGSAGVWSFLAATYDTDRDGVISAVEYPRDPAVLAQLDRDGDGALTAADFAGPTRMDLYVTDFVWRRLALREASPAAGSEAPAGAPSSGPQALPSEAVLERAFVRSDANRNGLLGEGELVAALLAAQAIRTPGAPDLPAGVRPFPSLLAAMDQDGSGKLSLAEAQDWRARQEAERSAEPAPGEPARRTPPVRPPSPELGTLAPDFTLRAPGGTSTTTLSSFRGTRPVALVFGSYTCPPFRHAGRWIRQAFDRYGRDVEFVFVYIREAHAVDGPAPMPAEDQPLVETPRTLEERLALARACSIHLQFTPFRTLVDDVDDAVARAYVAPPVRLYVLDRAGAIAYRSEPGPFGLDGPAFEKAVRDVAAGASAPPPPAEAARPAP